jgi:putative ABC transport system ATP-binding protein
LRTHALVKTYPSPSGPVRAIRGVSLDIFAGQLTVVTGRSGSGKTTLLNLLSGLDRPSGGEIWAGETPIHKLNEAQAAAWRGRSLGVVFQSFQLIPSLTALQNVTLPMDFAGRGTLPQRRARGLELLAELEIEQHAHKRPAQVSGGQQQRIAIARALANDPPMIVADEPTGSLDSATARSVMDIFRRLARQGKTVLVATHDRDLAAQADEIIHIHDGEIV